MGARDEDPATHAGGIVLLDAGVVLRVTERGNVNLPKGRIKKRETPEQAAVREVMEEAGLGAEIIEPLGLLDLSHTPKPQRILIFLMRAPAETDAWRTHLGTDALLVPAGEVEWRLTFREFRRFWRSVRGRVDAALGD